MRPRQIREVLRQHLPPAAVRAFDYYGRLRDLEEFALDNLDRTISRSVAARVVGLQPSPFSRFFTAKTGLQFIHWLTVIRVAYATWHLERRDIPLCHLAMASGFRDERSLRRAFVRVHGVCPRGFRKRLLRMHPDPGSEAGTPEPIPATMWPVPITKLAPPDSDAG